MYTILRYCKWCSCWRTIRQYLLRNKNSSIYHRFHWPNQWYGYHNKLECVWFIGLFIYIFYMSVFGIWIDTICIWLWLFIFHFLCLILFAVLANTLVFIDRMNKYWNVFFFCLIVYFLCVFCYYKSPKPFSLVTTKTAATCCRPWAISMRLVLASGDGDMEAMWLL